MKRRLNLKIPFIKTVTYRILGSIVSVSITYAVTGSVKASATLGAADLLLKPVVYFLHELAWQKVERRKL